MANLSNINNKFLVTTGGNVLIGGTAVVGTAKLQVTGEARVYTGSNLGYWGVDAGNSYVYLGTNSSAYGLSLQTGGIDRVNINDAGNVFISTPITNAFYGLSLTYNNTNTADFTVNQATGQIKIGGVATGYYPTFYAGGSEKMRIDTSGNATLAGNLTLSVASSFINTAAGDLYINPASNNTTLYDGANAQIFNVYNAGALAIKLNAGTGGGVLLARDGINFESAYSGNGLVLSHHGIGPSNAIVSGDSVYPDNLFINNSGAANDWSNVTIYGNVGINKTDPAYKLHIRGGSATEETVLKIDKTVTADSGGHITILALGTESGAWAKAGIGFERTGPYDVGKMHFLMYPTGLNTNTVGLSNSVMTINNDGNVGIGTTGPLSRLHVSESKVGNVGISVQNTNASYSSQIKFLNSTGTEKSAMTFVPSDNSLRFYNNGSDRMIITSGGALLVNRTSSLLGVHTIQADISGGGTSVLTVYNQNLSDNSPAINAAKNSATTSSTARFIQFYADGGTVPMGGIVGNGASNVQFAALSDIREKENVKTIESSLDKIDKLNPVEFDWKKSGEHIDAGFIAQEVENIFPEYVVENISNEGEDERKGLTGGMTSGIVAHLVKAIQELKAEIEILKNK